ncbi:MAG: D,D-heptose 1,7-bisphosphate phosphatase [Deltaproteobacteria bacterium RBG_19FT_COMBO_46_9]|nr:MAG: D,D-heptose 1,7-bisphosphate phosphatase [Deltaproteobacteria bacterium RBG_19FT_COMBO_46_9]
MKRPAVFIDRDGTINEQMGYINHLSRFHLIPGVADAIRLLNKNDFLAIIITNQSGVARGYFTMELLYEVHSLMIETLRRDGANIDAVFFCPHYPGGKVPEYSHECDCRKPRTGLIDQARDAFDIDMSRSYLVGDHTTDLELAHHCNLEGIMVRTGYGMGEISYILQQISIKPCYIAEDLLDAVKWIIMPSE